MFAVGDMVIYGGEGVCRVERIAPPEIRGMDKTRLYYTLSPFGRSGSVMTPVDTGVLMRPVMSREDAEAFLAQMAELPAEEPVHGGVRAQKEHYQQVVASYDCRQMAAFIKSACGRKKWAIAHGRKVSQLDERYLKRAWEQLVGELAAALGKTFSEAEDALRQSCPSL